MKTITHNLLLEFLQKAIEEPIKKGDKRLTNEVLENPVLFIQVVDSPICFTFGWDPTENHNVISLN